MSNNGQPVWIQKFRDTYSAAVSHAFILHFNTADYASPDSPLLVTDYLSRYLSTREVVAVYSRDRGIQFPIEGQDKLALEILGMDQAGGNNDPTLLALQSLGSAPASNDGELPSDPGEALPLLDKLLRSDRKTAVIVDGAELVLPPSDLATMQPNDRVALGIIRRWGRDTEIVSRGNPVFLITGNIANLHPELRAASSRFECIEIGLPDTETRTRFISRWLGERGQAIDLGDLTIQAIANNTAGLSLLHIEDILLRADARGKLTPSLIWDRKTDIIKSEFGDVLEIIQPRYNFEDIGGLDHVKSFMVRNVINPIRNGNRNRVPMGVIFTGPAGTGKSILAEAVSTEAGINAVKLNIGGNIASKWQGEGERNLAKALRAIEGLSPTLVFIDEIDQTVKRGGDTGGSQQDSRIFQMLLEFMADTSHRGKVIFVAATNRPDLLDPALKRPGRFDKSIPFLVPDDTERAAIIKVWTRKNLGEIVIANPEMLKVTEGWTGAELEGASVKAAEYKEDMNLSPFEAMLRAVSRLRPSTQGIEFMSLIALRECGDPDLLPPRYQETYKNREEIEQRIKTLEPQTRSKREL